MSRAAYTLQSLNTPTDLRNGWFPEQTTMDGARERQSAGTEKERRRARKREIVSWPEGSRGGRYDSLREKERKRAVFACHRFILFQMLSRCASLKFSDNDRFWFLIANGRDSRNRVLRERYLLTRMSWSRYTLSRFLLVEIIRPTGFISDCREVRNRFLRAHEI